MRSKANISRRTFLKLSMTAGASLLVSMYLPSCGELPASQATPATNLPSTRKVSERVTFDQGYKQIEEGIIVVHLKGNEAQMREQMQALLKDEIDAFEAVIRRNRTIQGLTEGGCTNFAAFGTATADGKLWHGRNFDFYGLGAMDRYRVVYIVEPEGRIPFAAIGYAGWNGPEWVHTSMNAQGISLGYDWANSNQEGMGDAPQLWQLLRRVTEESYTIDDAIAILQEGPRFSAANILIADGLRADAVVVEMTSKKMNVRRASDGAVYATNHFVAAEMQEPIKDPNSHARYQRIGDLLEANRGEVDLVKVASFLRDHCDVRTKREDLSGDVIASNVNVQSEIFAPADLIFWVAKGLAPAVYGEYVGFSLKDELAGNQDQTQLPTLPEDPILQSSMYASFQNFQNGYIAYLEGDYAVSVSEIEKAIASEPENGIYFYLLANAHMRQENYPEAIQAFQRTLASDINEVYLAYSYFRLGKIYEGMGDKEKMRAAFQKVLDLEIGDPAIEEPARRALSSGS